MENVGGTSASAPGYAALVAIILGALREQTRQPTLRFGAMNPTLYAIAAGTQNKQVFSDVTIGNNDLYSVGCCTAAVGYDPASGWGSIKFNNLYAQYMKVLTSQK